MIDLNTQLANMATTLSIDSERRAKMAKLARQDGAEQAAHFAADGFTQRQLLQDAEALAVMHEQASAALARKAKAAAKGIFLVTALDTTDVAWCAHFSGLMQDCQQEKRVVFESPNMDVDPTGVPTGTYRPGRGGP